MDFATPIEMTRADEAAAAAVRGLDSIDQRTPPEAVVQWILAAADYDIEVIRNTRELKWVQALNSSLDFQYYARIYTDGELLPAGSKQRVLDLLSEAESRLIGH